MKQKDDIPEGKLARGLEGGRTAARVGGVLLKYATKRALLSGEEKQKAGREMAEQSAEVIFEGLCRLKGTALKLAQLLSLEFDLIPSQVRTKLERSYSMVPPMNRALARKILVTAYGRPPEEVFSSFEARAFAAASLGQVHRAIGTDGRDLAVKILYPGIGTTIKSDIQLARGLFRPFQEYDLIGPVLGEIEARFLEETDYRQEAANVTLFREGLNIEQVRLPRLYPDLSTEQVLCLSFVEGRPLNQWLKGSPAQKDRDAVAQTLYRIFITGLYELRSIHADPNPGNYLVGRDSSVGLVDFGCVKRFRPAFVSLCRKLPRLAVDRAGKGYLELLEELDIFHPGPEGDFTGEVLDLSERFGAWLARLYGVEVFDFGRNKGFISQGKAIMNAMLKYRNRLNVNPDFVFLNRTRYGLLRLFELMGARVSFRNQYEWNDR